MKAGNLLLIGAAGLAVYYLGNLGIATNTVNFILSSVKVNSIKDFVVTVTVQNVSNANLTVNSMAGNILLNGQPFGNMSDFTKRVIQANAQTDVQVHISPDLSSIPATLLQLFQSPNPTMNFHVDGNANVNGLVLPFALDKVISA